MRTITFTTTEPNDQRDDIYRAFVEACEEQRVDPASVGLVEVNFLRLRTTAAMNAEFERIHTRQHAEVDPVSNEWVNRTETFRYRPTGGIEILTVVEDRAPAPVPG